MRLIFIIVIFHSFFAQAMQTVDLEKAKKLIEKNKPCNQVVGIVASKNRIYSKTYCVVDMTVNPKTVNARKGCTFSEYDLTNDKYYKTFGLINKRYTQASKGCSDGGFWELMEMNAYIDKYAAKDKEATYHSVLHALTYGVLFQSTLEKPNVVFLFGIREKYKEVWDKEYKKVMASHKANKKSEPKSNAKETQAKQKKIDNLVTKICKKGITKTEFFVIEDYERLTGKSFEPSDLCSTKQNKKSKNQAAKEG